LAAPPKTETAPGAARATTPDFLLAALAATVWTVLSVVGLLCRRLGVYDDSLLLLGARLVGAGREPYRDFYTHYGPFGYTLLAGPLQALVNPGVTLRAVQAAALVGLTILLFAAVRRTG